MDQSTHIRLAEEPQRNWVVDALRATAALVVCVGHARGLFFKDYPSISGAGNPGFIWTTLYLVTGYGHQAVLLFFCLSGLLVGGPLWKQWKNGQLNFRSYFLKRFTRLSVALWPALALGATLDYVGSQVLKLGGCYDATPEFQILCTYPLTEISDWATYLGNAFYVQTVFVRTAGTNGPLWSLPCEFWYYMMAGSLFLLAAKGRPYLLAKVTLVPATCFFFYRFCAHMWQGALIWAVGVVVFAAWQHKAKPPKHFVLAGFLLSSATLALSLLCSRRFSVVEWVRLVGSDLFVGLTVGFFVYFTLAMRWEAGAAVRKWAAIFADFSFSLYLIHVPVLVFVMTSIHKTHRFTPTVGTFLLWCLILGSTIAFAYVFSRFTEAKTDTVRKYLAAKLGISGPTAGHQKLRVAA